MARAPCRPAEDRIRVTLTVGSAREAARCLLAADCLCCQRRDELPDGPERRGAEEVIGKLRQLGRWFGSLIEEGE